MKRKAKNEVSTPVLTETEKKMTRKELYVEWLSYEITRCEIETKKLLEEILSLPTTHRSHRLEAIGNELVQTTVITQIGSEALSLSSRSWADIGTYLLQRITPSRSASTDVMTNYINKERLTVWLDIYRHYIQFSSAPE